DIQIFQTRIRRNVKLAESPSYGRTIFEYERNCHGAWDYNALADEVEEMVAGGDKNAVLPEQLSKPQADDVAIVDEQLPADATIIPEQAASEPSVQIELGREEQPITPEDI
ncbi:MAG: hypothetical protein KAJ52_00115, partial [Sedimentisphaerales bacterium]|nr:hypothetical protein [Sedimentisphaerales bacterium]